MSFLPNYFQPKAPLSSGDAAVVKAAKIHGWRHRQRKDSLTRLPERANRDLRSSSYSQADSVKSSSRAGSIYPLRETRGGKSLSDLLDIKCEVMVNWLQQQQVENMWSRGGVNEGVVLKKRANDFVGCPASLAEERGGYFDAVCLLNVKCAITVNTRMIQLLVARTEMDYIHLADNLRLQILPTMSYLPQCQKHHFAAFIRDQSLLVIWQDDPQALLEKVRSLQKQLLDVVWEAEETFCKISDSVDVAYARSTEVDDDLETGVEAPRTIKLTQSFMVAITLMLSIVALGAGWRQITIETAVDLSYLRLLFVICIPLQLWLAQTIVGCLFQCFGPVQQLKQNSRYFSAQRQPRILRQTLPHVTIQCPVYKESLRLVIGPTIRSIKAAISTYEMQGGTANIFVNDDGLQFLSEDLVQERIEFYEEHSIGWVARPRDNAVLYNGKRFVRGGKFKKASNMNHALAISIRIEDKLAAIDRDPTWTARDETDAYGLCLQEAIAEDGSQSWAAGNIRVGDYILLVDSDTIVPEDCLFDACNEMECSPQAAIIQFRSGVLNVTSSYFERGITYFTNLIYTNIAFAVACGDVAPFVGHNAILRWSAIQDVAWECESGFERYWSETTVSEDFDMALRLQAKGYHVRYGDYFGDQFKEGVSLTVYDELLRWEKYAFGCSELIFHPILHWPRRGPFTPLFRRFICSGIPLPSKVTIMAYIGTYYAIGSAWFLTLLNYILVGWYNTLLDHYYIDSFRLLFSILVVFTCLGNFALAVLRYRQGSHNLLRALWENIKWIPLLAVFLGGVSMHVHWAIVAHLLGLEMSWGSTAKTLENTTIAHELIVVWRKFRRMLCFCILMFAVVVVMAVAVPPFWRIDQLIAVLPLCNVLASHVLLPLALNPGMMLFSF